MTITPNPYSEGLSIIGQNLGMHESLIIMLVLNVALLVIYAKGFKLGTAIGFITNAALFIAYYQLDTMYEAPLVVMLMYLVILSLTLYTQTTKPQLQNIA